MFRDLVRRLVDAIKAEAGEGAAVLVDWRNIVPEVHGKTFGCAAWLQSFPRVNITGLPHAAELVAALGDWHTARTIVENVWLRLGTDERAGVPPLPAGATRKTHGREAP